MIFRRKRPAASWCALFVRSASPGAVIRFLERRRAILAQQAGSNALAAFAACGPDLVLGEAAPGTEPWRALVAPGATHGKPSGAWMEKTGADLATAFAPGVTLLFADDTAGAWGWRVWVPGAAETAPETEHGGELPPAPTLVQRLAGHARAQSPTALAVTWASERGLPAARIPALLSGGRFRRENVPLVAYETVAGLDARGLLREDGPRWYTTNRLSSEQPPTV